MRPGEIIQKERTRLGLSQEKLAEQVGVSRQAVSKWEVGDAVPDTDKLLPLARALGISVDTLLDNQPQQTQPEVSQTEGERHPEWLALYWHWLGVPLSVWGMTKLVQMVMGLSAAVNMTGGAVSIQSLMLLMLPSAVLPLAAVFGGIALFWFGRRTIRRKYGKSGGEMPTWRGVQGLLAQCWYWLGVLVAAVGVLGCGIKLSAALRLYRQLSMLKPLFSGNIDVGMDPSQLYEDFIPPDCLNSQGEIVYDKVFALLGQGLLFLAVGILLGAALFFGGRRRVRGRSEEKDEKFVAK